jgi:hypothetical protein
MSISTSSLVKNWTGQAAAALEGRTIVRVRYLREEELQSLYWRSTTVVLELDDGTLIFPSRDDEGNDAGALFTNLDDLLVVPTIQP